MVVQSGGAQATQLPAAEQLVPLAQVPHETLPQPLETVPQVLPWQAWVVDWGVQQALLVHTLPLAHVFGHETVPPQPLGAVPQATPVQAAAAVFGVQHAPLAHCMPAAQVPQVTVPPQTSLTVPQVAFDCWQRLESSSTSLQAPATQV
jgi:hypothetical protein